jgi:hypothetical protein
LYADDNIIVGSAGCFIAEVKTTFERRLNVQDMGMVSWLLGMTMERHYGSHTITIGKRQYVLDMLERLNIEDCKSVGSPLAVDAFSNCVEETPASKLPSRLPTLYW